MVLYRYHSPTNRWLAGALLVPVVSIAIFEVFQILDCLLLGFIYVRILLLFGMLRQKRLYSAIMDRMSRSDHKKKKELEEARKAGTLPPEKDDEGNLINPHIPEFMSKAPWYLNQEGPGLKHQKAFRPEHTQVRVRWSSSHHMDGFHVLSYEGIPVTVHLHVL